MTDMFHMGWFLSFNAGAWRAPWSGRIGSEFASGQLYVDMAQSLERAGFDYLMFEDSLMVSDFHGGSMATNLKYG